MEAASLVYSSDGQRVGRYALGRRVGGPALGPGAGQGRGSVRLDPDHPDSSGEPGGDAADQPAAADRDEDGV